MNGEVGRRFRREVLNRGGEVPAAEIVRRFLGRAVNADAFFKEIVGERV
jgi:thimet oligopeptidase